MLKVWGRKTSINVQKVAWTVAELGIPHERGRADGVLGHAAEPDIAGLNPNKLVPVIDDDGFVMWESNAIVRYLARRYGGGPVLAKGAVGNLDEISAAQAFSTADKWMDWSITTLYPDIITTLFWQVVRIKAVDRKHDQVAAAAARAGKNLGLVEAQLGHDGFLLGKSAAPSIADIAVGTLLYRYFTLPIERPALPKVEAYYQRLTRRAAYKDGVMIDWLPMKVPGA